MNNRLQLNKYLTPEENVDQENKEVVEHSKPREVQVTSIDRGKVGEFLAKTLIEALRREEFEFIDNPESNGEINPIFKDIRVVSTEDINNDLIGAINFAKGGNLLVTDLVEAETPSEKMFLSQTEDLNTYNSGLKGSIVSHVKEEIAKDMEEELSSIEKPIEAQEDLFKDKDIGDEYEHEGQQSTILYKDRLIALIRIQGETITHLVIDRTKGE